MNQSSAQVTLLTLVMGLGGCSTKYREDLDFPYNVEQTLTLREIESDRLIQFESVRWDPDNHARLRRMIVDDQIASGRDVLEIGTETGLISVLCLMHSASKVVATDSSPVAVANAIYNAATQQVDGQLSVRQVDPRLRGTFAGIDATEKFDLIIRNAPRETSAEFDSGMMETFLNQLPRRLNPGGRCIAFCFRPDELKSWQSASQQRGYELTILGNRDFESLVGEIYPAAMLEIRISIERLNEIE